MTSPGPDIESLIADASGRLEAWAECVQRLAAVAPVEAVADEVGIVGPIPHSTPEDRKALRAKARATVAAWLARDLAALRAALGEPNA